MIRWEIRINLTVHARIPSQALVFFWCFFSNSHLPLPLTIQAGPLFKQRPLMISRSKLVHFERCIPCLFAFFFRTIVCRVPISSFYGTPFFLSTHSVRLTNVMSSPFLFGLCSAIQANTFAGSFSRIRCTCTELFFQQSIQLGLF